MKNGMIQLKVKIPIEILACLEVRMGVEIAFIESNHVSTTGSMEFPSKKAEAVMRFFPGI